MTSSYAQWKARLSELHARHSANPENLDIAEELWTVLNGGIGNNLKSVDRAFDTFAVAAMASTAGATALARALREVFAVTGQAPKKAQFHRRLRTAVREALLKTGDQDLAWLARHLE